MVHTSPIPFIPLNKKMTLPDERYPKKRDMFPKHYLQTCPDPAWGPVLMPSADPEPYSLFPRDLVMFAWTGFQVHLGGPAGRSATRPWEGSPIVGGPPGHRFIRLRGTPPVGWVPRGRV